MIRGDEQPKLNYFANITLDYKKWNLEVLFQGVQGVDAYYSEPYSFGLNVGGDGQTPLAVQKTIGLLKIPMPVIQEWHLTHLMEVTTTPLIIGISTQVIVA